MQDELDDHQEEYCSLTHEYWCDLLSKNEVKYNRKRTATQIKNIVSDRAASNSDSNRSVKIPRKKKSRTDFFPNDMGPNHKAPTHHGTQRHCAICKKEGMPEKNYMLHSDKECFGKRINHNTIKDGMGLLMGSRYESISLSLNLVSMHH